MDFPCENEITVRSDNALRFAIATKPAPVIEYLKTIASLIGAPHILGVFEDGEFIKVYFDDKKIVDTLIRSGIHVMGHHIKVDYVVPPGSKVILSNIDPLVSNYDLIKLMSVFGLVVSPVFRSPISDDIQLCHIDHGVRYLYMNINTPVPDTLEFKYGDQICKINIKLDNTLAVIPCVKKEPDESNTSESSLNATPDNSAETINVDYSAETNNADYSAETININSTDPINAEDNLNITDPIVVSVQSATEEVNQEQQIESPQPHDETSKHKLLKVHHAKHIKTSQTNKKIRPNVKYRSKRGKKFRITKKKDVENIACIKQLPHTPLNVQHLSSTCTSSLDDSSMQLSDISDSFVNENTESILDEDKLKLFLEEVKCQREPIEIVKKYVGPDSNSVRCLIKQLIDLRKKTDDAAIKGRMRRLITHIKNSLDV